MYKNGNKIKAKCEVISKDMMGVKEYLIKIRVKKTELNNYLKNKNIKPNEHYRKALLACLENSAYAIIESDLNEGFWGKENLKEKIDMGY